LALADRVDTDSVCDYVGSERFRQERDQLDEELNDLWSHRLAELHAGVASKDTEARRIGRSALQFGGIIAVASGFLAMFLSRHLAKTLSQPLASLALNARRVGAGDFSTTISIKGPSEVQILAREFERMRAHLVELEQLKQGFLASISHELRTPLSKLREAIALLQDRVVGEISPEQDRVLAIAKEACEREIRMVSTLLDLSRLRAGSPIRQHTGRSIDEVIRRAVREEQAEVKDRQVKVELHLEGAPPACHVDTALVERSIANLVRNALAVSQNGQRVTVRRTHCEDPKYVNVIRITINDEGPGVPRDIQDTVFSPFVTSAVPRSPKALGIGLGLALAREVALAHGGDLILDTSAPLGATFHFLIPHVTARSQRSISSRQPKLLPGFMKQ
jgi:two-component system sensor histidine kinase GlrK